MATNVHVYGLRGFSCIYFFVCTFVNLFIIIQLYHFTRHKLYALCVPCMNIQCTPLQAFEKVQNTNKVFRTCIGCLKFFSRGIADGKPLVTDALAAQLKTSAAKINYACRTWIETWIF